MKFSLDVHAPLRINLYTMGFPCVIYYVMYSVFQDLYFFSFSGRHNLSLTCNVKSITDWIVCEKFVRRNKGHLCENDAICASVISW